MNIKETGKKVIKNAKERIDPKTTGSRWAKIRNACGIAAAVGFLIVSPACPFAIPAAVASWVTFGSSVLAVVGGVAHLDKSKK